MSHIPFATSGNTLTYYVRYQPYQIDASFPGYTEALELLKQGNPDEDRLIALAEPAIAVAEAVAAAENRYADPEAPVYLPRGVVSVTRTGVSYNGVPMEGVLVDRIMQMLADGFDIMPMVRFVENLKQNPSPDAQSELYLWLESSTLPITADGHFLAYKYVNDDFTSVHDSKTDNTPGTKPSMPRHAVDPNRDQTCSRGLHFCSKSYLNTGYAIGRKVVVLKINPADVVAIPNDYDNAKGRAWTYEVLAEVDHDIPTYTWESVVGEDGGEYDADSDYDEWDDDIDGDPGYGEPDDESDHLLNTSSELAINLFKAIRDLGITDRQERLDWASDVLDHSVNTFSLLDIEDAEMLLEEAIHEKVKNEQSLRQFRINTINNLNIVGLRRQASKAGYKGAWHGAHGADLRNFLLDQVV